MKQIKLNNLNNQQVIKSIIALIAVLFGPIGWLFLWLWLRQNKKFADKDYGLLFKDILKSNQDIKNQGQYSIQSLNNLIESQLNREIKPHNYLREIIFVAAIIALIVTLVILFTS